MSEVEAADMLVGLPENTLLAKFFVLDENLDREAIQKSGVIIRSFCKKFSKPVPEDEARLLVLVRSANDSETLRYFERTHGFFPHVHANNP
jgi:hypothetical protein